MTKQLFVFILSILFFTAANAQNQADSTKTSTDTTKVAPVDTVIKRAPADTATVKRDTTTVKHDTAIVKHDMTKHAPVDSLAKAKRSSTDSLSKSSAVDSLANHDSGSTKKHSATSSAAKTAPVVVVAAKKPDTDPNVKHSTVKTLSDDRYNALLKGDDFDNMSLVGEMNHYPLPGKALKHKVELGLNPGQITKLKEVATELQRKKLEMGGNIIQNEKMLDSLFHSHKIVDGTIIFYSNRYGLYLGELRNAILQACYKTEDILSVVQVKKLESLEK